RRRGSRRFLPQLLCMLPQTQFIVVAGALVFVAIGAGLACSINVRPHVHDQVSEAQLLVAEHVFAVRAASEDRGVDGRPRRAAPPGRALGGGRPGGGGVWVWCDWPGVV